MHKKSVANGKLNGFVFALDDSLNEWKEFTPKVSDAASEMTTLEISKLNKKNRNYYQKYFNIFRLAILNTFTATH